MACCQMAPSHFLIQCLLTINEDYFSGSPQAFKQGFFCGSPNKSLWLHMLGVHQKFGGLISCNSVLAPSCTSVGNPLKNMGCTDPQFPLIWKPAKDVNHTELKNVMQEYTFKFISSSSGHETKHLLHLSVYITVYWIALRYCSVICQEPDSHFD